MKIGVLCFAAFVIGGFTAAAQAKLVACIGDSITYGAGIADRPHDSYPAQLQRILQQYDPTWEVRNFGVSGATLLRRGDKPYIRETAYASALACNPDIVIIKLGTNDSKPQNWQYKDDFIADYGNLIDAFRALPCCPQVWICKPVPAFTVNFAIRPEVIRAEILPLIDQVSRESNAPVIDLYTALINSGGLFPDAIHPNAEGAGLIARAVAPLLLGVRFLPDYNSDGIIDLQDFARLARFWLAAETSFDVAPSPNGDGLVGYQDLAGLARYWMTYPGLIAHWEFDETGGDLAADSLGRFHGVLYGWPLWRPTDGRRGGSIELDGIDDCIRTGNVLNPAGGPFTVSAWVRGGQPGRAILSQSAQLGAGEVWLGTHVSTGALLTNLTDNSRNAASVLVSETVVTDEAWHLVRLVWDGSFRRLYVDNREVAADTRELGGLKHSAADFNIGAGKALEPGSFWSGQLDDIRIYNRAIKP